MLNVLPKLKKMSGAGVLAFGLVWSGAASAVALVEQPVKALLPALEVKVTDQAGRPVGSQVGFSRTNAESEKVQEYSLSGGGDAWSFTQVGGTLLPQTFSFNPDPLFTYAFGVTNNTASPLTFTFNLSGPYVGGPYTQMVSSHSSSVTALGGGATVGTGINPFIHTPTLDGSAVGGLAAGDGCTITGNGSFPCDATGAPLTTTVSSAASGLFGVVLSWTLSPGDSYSLNGLVELLPPPAEIPEPGTLALLLAGLTGILAIGRRRLN